MTDFERLLRALADRDVEFVIVGGMAATLHGAARLTQDLDVVYRRTPENFARLRDALAPLTPYPRGAPPGLPFRWDEQSLARGLNFTLATAAGDLDLLGEIVGGGTYEDLASDAVDVPLFGLVCKTLGLERLIDVKRAAGRPKDFEAIAELEALLEERRRSE